MSITFLKLYKWYQITQSVSNWLLFNQVYEVYSFSNFCHILLILLTHNLVVVWIHSGGQATAFSLRARGIEQTESCCLASDWGTIQINPFLELPRIKNILRYEEILHWSPSLCYLLKVTTFLPKISGLNSQLWQRKTFLLINFPCFCVKIATPLKIWLEVQLPPHTHT